MKLAFLYAGQGSQKAGMGRDLYENYPAFRKAFDAAALDFDLRRVCFEDPDGVINQTQYTQPCMVAFAAGVTAVLREQGVVPEYAAGLSLGEYSALCCAGVFTAKSAVELAAYRGAAMAKAAEGVESAMTAVLNLDREALTRCCEEASALGVVRICNYNCPGQLVIGGEKAAVVRAGELAKEAGARRLMPLRVSGPFHTPLMQPAADALRARFESEAFGTMEIPVLFNCLGHEMGEGDTIPALLERQVRDSVYMEDTIRRLAELGVDTVIEIGPGRALSGFVQKTVGNAISCYAIEDCASLEKAIEAVKA
ncbi:MAG: ACP S-malonyltransferase [Clostridia bacterium]|nr:ACP S-malonyltransferase [Clostridia bacterium]